MWNVNKDHILGETDLFGLKSGFFAFRDLIEQKWIPEIDDRTADDAGGKNGKSDSYIVGTGWKGIQFIIRLSNVISINDAAYIDHQKNTSIDDPSVFFVHNKTESDPNDEIYGNFNEIFFWKDQGRGKCKIITCYKKYVGKELLFGIFSFKIKQGKTQKRNEKTDDDNERFDSQYHTCQRKKKAERAAE